MTTQTSPQLSTSSVDWTKFAVRMTIVCSFFPILLFLSAGSLDWRMGWVYIILAISITVISRYLMIRRNPGLFAERSQALSREDTKGWDKILSPTLALGPLVIIVIAGLDYRLDWSPAFSVWVELLGLVLLIIGYLFATWAMLVNAYFSSAVRIQTDRGQQVVTNGPYRIVRHPSYLGLLLGNVGTSLVLSSLWSLIPTAILTIVIIVRTALEDATLQNELPGYRDYAQKTRYRLIPGLW